MWFNVRSLIDACNDGGLISYFYNSGADTLEDCLAGLATLDSARVSAQIGRVAALFTSGVPADQDARNAAIDSWEDSSEVDELLDSVDDALDALFPELGLKLNRFVRERLVA
jgi:hypothetical protein